MASNKMTVELELVLFEFLMNYPALTIQIHFSELREVFEIGMHGTIDGKFKKASFTISPKEEDYELKLFKILGEKYKEMGGEL